MPETMDQGEEFEEPVSRVNTPSSIWYLVPFFFGIIGGIVGYVGTSKDDNRFATNLLLFGLLWTIVLVVLFLLLF